MRFAKLQSSFTIGRLSTAATSGQRLFFVRHDDLEVVRIDAEEARLFMPKLTAAEKQTFFGGHLDDRFVHVAFDDGDNLFILDQTGSIHRRTPEGVLTSITEPDPRTAGHYAHRVGFAWDPRGRRLVIAGGPSRNDTHVLDEGASALRSLDGPGPSHGLGRAVGSSAGLYYVVADELWLLEGEQWSFVAALGSYRFARPIPWVDEAKQRLLLLTRAKHGAPERLLACDALGPTELDPTAHAPSLSSELLDDHDACLGFDPTARRMILANGQGLRAAQLPEADAASGGWPRTPRPTRPRVIDPPLSWYREALAIDVEPEHAPVELPASLVPDGRIVLGILPESPFLPIAGRSLLLLAHDPPYEANWYDLSFDNAFEVVISDQALPACLPAKDGRTLRPLVLGPRFREIDPAYAERVDSLTGGEPRRSTRSKIGGFPFLLQGGDAEASSALFADLRCPDCSAYVRFALQLHEHFRAMSGVLYVYLCPLGCSGAAYVQSS